MEADDRKCLCLTRHEEQIVDVTVGGEKFEIRLIHARGGKAKLVFLAGPAVIIHRREVTERIAEGRL